MEEDRHNNKNDPMNTDQPEEDAPPYSTPLGSPSYSPPPLEEYYSKNEEEKEDNDRDDDDEEEEDHETGEEKAARRKAKGKGKASETEEDDNNNNNNTAIDMDTYWAREAHDVATSYSPPSYYDQEIKFGDADAAMNEALFPPSPSSNNNYNKENENSDPAHRAPTNTPERSSAVALAALELTSKLKALQQREHDRGGGRGRGRGKGWGLLWQETMTGQKVESEGWGDSDNDDPNPSPVQEENLEWEVYDPDAWERATQKAAAAEEEGERRQVVSLKVPGATLSVKGSSDTREGGRLRDLIEERETARFEERQSGEFVRAVRGYKAILPGTYLSYEKDDVMRVIYRDPAGRFDASMW